MQIKEDFVERDFFSLFLPFRPCSVLPSSSFPSTPLFCTQPSLNLFFSFFFFHDRPRTFTLRLPLDYKPNIYTTTLQGSVENCQLINYLYLSVSHENKEKFTLQFISSPFWSIFLIPRKHASHMLIIGSLVYNREGWSFVFSLTAFA